MGSALANEAFLAKDSTSLTFPHYEASHARLVTPSPDNITANPMQHIICVPSCSGSRTMFLPTSTSAFGET